MLTADNSDYKKSLTYYYIGQFSKVIQPGAVEIANSKYISDIHVTSFKNPDGSIVVVMFNGSGNDVNFKLCMKDMMFKDTLDRDSMISYIIK